MVFPAAGEPGFKTDFSDGSQVLKAGIGMKSPMKRSKCGTCLEVVALMAGIEPLILATGPHGAAGSRPGLPGCPAPAGAMKTAHEAQHLAQVIVVLEILGEYAFCRTAKLVLLQHTDKVLCRIGDDARIAQAVAAIEATIPEQLLGVSHLKPPSFLRLHHTRSPRVEHP
jgi:hypothetical protein